MAGGGVRPVSESTHDPLTESLRVVSRTPYTWAEKFESFERINSIRETDGNFDSCNSCKRLGTSRLHELHELKFPFVSRIEFIRSKLSNLSAHVYGVTVSVITRPGHRPAKADTCRGWGREHDTHRHIFPYYRVIEKCLSWVQLWLKWLYWQHSRGRTHSWRWSRSSSMYRIHILVFVYFGNVFTDARLFICCATDSW